MKIYRFHIFKFCVCAVGSTCHLSTEFFVSVCLHSLKLCLAFNCLVSKHMNLRYIDTLSKDLYSRSIPGMPEGINFTVLTVISWQTTKVCKLSKCLLIKELRPTVFEKDTRFCFVGFTSASQHQKMFIHVDGRYCTLERVSYHDLLSCLNVNHNNVGL